MDTPEPQPQPPQHSETQQLPHLVVNEPKRSPWAVAGIVVLSLMVLGIPVGLFLVQQQTNLTPEASVVEPSSELATGVIMESRFSPDSKGGIIPVDIYVKSSQDAINLAKVNFKFDPAFLEVKNIATDAASFQKTQHFNKWLEVNSNNTSGKATIIAGLPTPGIKTSDLSEGKAYLGTLNLAPKRSGSTVLQVGSDSQFLRNLDNQNVFSSGSDLVMNLTVSIGPTPEEIKGKSPVNAPAIVITSPKVAANYSFFKPIEIVWSAFNVETISQINLYVNGAFFGPITQNLDAKAGKYTWNPQESLSLPYIQLANTFMVEVIGIGKDGEVAKVITGPFGIIGQVEVVSSPPNMEVFLVNSLSVEDTSRLMSNYLILPLQEKSLDFNKDEVINELDFYLLKQNLLGRGVIK